MRITQFVERIKLGWRAFRAGTKTSAEAVPPRNKDAHNDDAIPMSTRETLEKWTEDPDGLPPGLPGSAEIRRIADVLAHQCPVDAVHALIQAKDYTACHELAGFHEAIQTLRDIADNVDAVNDEATKAAQAASR